MRTLDRWLVRLLIAVLIAAPFAAELSAQLPLPSRRPLGESRLRAVRNPPPRLARTLFRWSSATEQEESGPPETIETDRPDFVEASSAVGLGVRQLETGYTYLEDDDGSDQTRGHTYPEALFRWGVLANWLEFRLGWSVVEERLSAAGGVSRTEVGGSDLYLGTKLWLTEQHEWLPEMSIVPQMLVPSGDEAFSGDEVLPGINWLYGWDINDWLALGMSTQINRRQDDLEDFYSEFAQAMTLNYQFTERFGGYTEYFAFFPNGSEDPGTGTEHYFDGGFRQLLSRDVQLDIRAGTGLNDRALDFFAGAGLSFRF